MVNTSLSLLVDPIFVAETHGTCCPLSYAWTSVGTSWTPNGPCYSTTELTILTPKTPESDSLLRPSLMSAYGYNTGSERSAIDSRLSALHDQRSTYANGTTYQTVMIHAQSISIRHRSGDFLQASPTITPATPAPTSQDPTSKAKVITKEATIGIAISVPVASIGIFFGILFYLAHRQRKRRSRTADVKENIDYRTLKPELSAETETQRYEIDGDGAKTSAAELDAVDTSFLREMGTGVEGVARKDGIVKIGGESLDVDFAVDEKKR